MRTWITNIREESYYVICRVCTRFSIPNSEDEHPGGWKRNVIDVIFNLNENYFLTFFTKVSFFIFRVGLPNNQDRASIV
jgi:hypothetical protein